MAVVTADTSSSLRETEYLLRSPANAERLLASIAQVEAGSARPHDVLSVADPAGETDPTG